MSEETTYQVIYKVSADDCWALNKVISPIAEKVQALSTLGLLILVFVLY